MNICFVIGAMKFSGAEKVLSMIAKELLGNNNRVSIILLEQEHSIIGDEEGITTYGAKANGNNVDAETEANNILQIQMQYRLLSQLTSFEFSQLNSVMKK